MADPETKPNDDFAKQAEGSSDNLASEFFQFLSENKKWWLLPIIIVVLLFGVLFLAGPSVAPFIYTLF